MADKRNFGNRAKQGEQQKPTSRPKFPTPRLRSHREQDANVTLLGVPESRSTYSLANRSMRPNMDFTFAAPSMPSRFTPGGRQNLDSTFAAPSVPKPTSRTITGNTNTMASKKADLAYNDYLQALMKKEIVNKTIKAHEEKINDQILIQTEQLHSLQLTLDNIDNEIDNLKEQENMVQLLDFLKPKVKQVEDLLEKYRAENNLLKLQHVLTKESDLVNVKNIKTIESQAEFDKLMEVLEKLKVLLEKITGETSCLEDIHDVAKDFRHFKLLNGEIMETVSKIDKVNKKAARQLIRKLSDLFAQRNGYF